MKVIGLPRKDLGVNEKLSFGSGAHVYYNGSDLVWKLRLAGTGNFLIDAALRFTSDRADPGSSSVFINRSTTGSGRLRYNVASGDEHGFLVAGVEVISFQASVVVSNMNILASAGIRIGSNSTNNEIDDATQGSASTQLFIGNESIDTTASDARLKDKITAPNGLALKHLNALSGALEEYEYIAGQKRWVGNRYVGHVAQHLDDVLPEYVLRPDDGENTWSVKYNYMVGPLLWGWRDHESRLAKLESKLGVT